MKNEVANQPTSFGVGQIKNNLGGGKWRGGKDSWGNNRIWLEPAQGTDNKDRTGLSIHGGKEYGSGGCIDLTDKMDDFTDKFKKYGHDMILNVNMIKIVGNFYCF